MSPAGTMPRIVPATRQHAIACWQFDKKQRRNPTKFIEILPMPQYKDPGKIEFDATMIEAGGGGMYVEFPEDVSVLFGVKGRVPIKARLDGIFYRGSLVKMGTDCHVLGVLKQIREALRKGAGDLVHVEIELDLDERRIDLAEDVKAVMKRNKSASATWDKLSFTHKREFHRWIEEAKRPETRANRIIQMIGKLSVGETLS